MLNLEEISKMLQRLDKLLEEREVITKGETEGKMKVRFIGADDSIWTSKPFRLSTIDNTRSNYEWVYFEENRFYRLKEKNT